MYFTLSFHSFQRQRVSLKTHGDIIRKPSRCRYPQSSKKKRWKTKKLLFPPKTTPHMLHFYVGLTPNKYQLLTPLRHRETRVLVNFNWDKCKYN